MRRIYVASSWRNPYQPDVVALLRRAGHQVYDFRQPAVGYPNPNPLARGFQWSEIDPDWLDWTNAAFREALAHPLSEQGFASDRGAMEWADTCVLVLPSGRSAHAEAGWMAGRGKEVYVLLLADTEPELMYRLFTGICTDVLELVERLKVAETAAVLA